MAAWHAESFRSNASSAVVRQSEKSIRGSQGRRQHSIASEIHVGRTVRPDKRLDQRHLAAERRGHASDESRHRTTAPQIVQPFSDSRSFHAMHEEADPQKRRSIMQTINSLALNPQSHINRLSRAGSTSEVPLNRRSTWGSNILTDVGDEYVLYKDQCVPMPASKGGTGDEPAHGPAAFKFRLWDVHVPEHWSQDMGGRIPGWLWGLTLVSAIGLTVTAAAALVFSMRAKHLVQQFDTSNLQKSDLHHLPEDAYHDLQSPARMLMPQKAGSPGSGQNLLQFDDGTLNTNAGAYPPH